MSKQVWLPILLLCLLCSFLYVPALNGPLLFDDIDNISSNNWVTNQSGSFDNLRAAAQSGRSSHLGRPISMLSFALHYLGNNTPSEVIYGMKIAGLVLHLLVGLLVFVVLRMLNELVQVRRGPQQSADPSLIRGNWLLPAICAGLWLLHPLHVSTTMYVVQRMTVLAALFSMLAITVFVYLRVSWTHRQPTVEDVIVGCLWVLILTLLSLLSKENGILAIPLIAVLELCFFRGVINGRTQKAVVALAGLTVFAIPFALSIVILWEPSFIVGGYGARDFTFHERILSEVVILKDYLGWLIFPRVDAYSFNHDNARIVSSAADIEFQWSLTLIITMLVAATLVARKWPFFLCGALFFFVGHSMESTVYPLELQFEHRNYLPSLGIVLMVYQLLKIIDDSQPRRTLVLVSLLLVSVLSLQLGLRSLRWSNEYVLTSHLVESERASYRSLTDHAAAMIRGPLALVPVNVADDITYQGGLLELRTVLERANAKRPHFTTHLSMELLVSLAIKEDAAEME
ncbi:hypothetical protein, partial [Marinobacter alexandrii]|uniref:hypothetical protein n=1 Tax=Marinobacter alexandrii TaxID=2570351 RepID=UPI0032995FF7